MIETAAINLVFWGGLTIMTGIANKQVYWWTVAPTFVSWAGLLASITIGKYF